VDKRILLHSAPLAALVYWSSTLAAIRFNPGFNPLKHPFSLLGTPEFPHPWIYNAGMAAAGMLYSIYGLAIASSREWRRPGVLLAAAGLCPVAAAALPGRSLPHIYASRLFFLFSAAAFAMLGIGWMRGGARKMGAAMLLAALIGPSLWLAVKATYNWPGALGEIYGLLLVDFFMLSDWWLRLGWGYRKT